MATKDERYVNVTLKNGEDEDKEEIVISFSTFGKVLKRFLLCWIVIALIAGILIPVYFAIFTADKHKNLTALVSFNYDGIEDGNAPDGSKFDINSIKSPTIIEQALTDLGESLELVEPIRQNILPTGLTPVDAVNKAAAYKTPLENGNIAAVQEILDTKIYPTQFQITFNYAASGLSGEKAVEVFNSILNNYRDYFFKAYGFNQALGSAMTALDYTDYDFAEAVDVFDSTLLSLENYIRNLSAEDTTRFRSTATGYSFADLSQSIETLRTVDLDRISSYIIGGNVTRNRDKLIQYYNYRIDQLTRDCTVAKESLASLEASIASYQKDSIIVYGGDGTDMDEYVQASAEYDNLIEKKNQTQNTLSSKTQEIQEYQQRMNALKIGSSASEDSIAEAEKDLSALNQKINTLMDATNQTANEYYETVYLANSYNILVPPSTSGLTTTTSILKSAAEPMLIAEALIFVLYLGASFVIALIEENKKKKVLPAAADGDEPEDAQKEDTQKTETE